MHPRGLGLCVTGGVGGGPAAHLDHDKKGGVRLCNSVSLGLFKRGVCIASLPRCVTHIRNSDCLFPFDSFHSTFTKQPLLTIGHELGPLLRESHSPVRKVGQHCN